MILSTPLLVFIPLFLGVTELVIILLIVLLIFGGRKIPDLMQGIGRGIRAYKDASKDDAAKEAKKENKKKQAPRQITSSDKAAEKEESEK